MRLTEKQKIAVAHFGMNLERRLTKREMLEGTGMKANGPNTKKFFASLLKKGAIVRAGFVPNARAASYATVEAYRLAADAKVPG